MVRKFLFVGAINEGNIPEGGAIAKNQILVKKLKTQKEINLVCADTYLNNFKIFVGIKLIIQLIIFKNILFSISTKSLSLIAKFNFFIKRKNVIIFIVGGDADKTIEQDKSLIVFFENSRIVYAETHSLVSKLKNLSGKINAKYLPNFKPVLKIRTTFKLNSDKEIRLVFLSRISVDKGIFRALELLDFLNSNERSDQSFVLDIYGPFDLSENEKKKFDDKVRNTKGAIYRGVLDLRSKRGYEVLSGYHFFLFLTLHHGEGFPGVIIDALIAQVPIIASDWAYNREILPGGCLVVDLSYNHYFDLISDYIYKITQMCKTDYVNLLNLLGVEGQKYNIDEITLDI